jgi:hypothetical protein
MAVARKMLSIGGIEYELQVRDELTGYYGACFCRACHEGRVRYDLVPSVKAAFQQAEAYAKLHHAEKHPYQ